jgi:hypothetical protein
MEKFKALNVRVIPNGAHFNYFSNVKNELANAPQALVESLGALPEEFLLWYSLEDQLMLWVYKSDLTDLITEADKRMDKALTNLNALVRALRGNLQPTVAASAKAVYEMLKKYKNVIKKPYEEQAGDVRAILQQITSGGAFYNDIITIYGAANTIMAMVTEVKNSFDAFVALLAQRDEQSLTKPDKTFKEVRKGIEGVYHKMVDIIDAGSLMNTSPAYATFIKHLNPEIDRLNEEFHRVRHDIAHSQPEEIPAQQYTGYPVNPTPKVLYVTAHNGTVRLELGKDYDLRYKDNIEVGNAQCTIRGIGGYKGSKTVSFIIKRV